MTYGYIDPPDEPQAMESYLSEFTDTREFFSRARKWTDCDGKPHWLGQMLCRALMEELNTHYPESVFPILEDNTNRDYGPMVVSELRRIVG